MRVSECRRDPIVRLLPEIKGRGPFQARKLEGIDDGSVTAQEAFETLPSTDNADLGEAYPPESDVSAEIRSRIGITVTPGAVPVGYLPRGGKKMNRMFDNRYLP